MVICALIPALGPARRHGRLGERRATADDARLRPGAGRLDRPVRVHHRDIRRHHRLDAVGRSAGRFFAARHGPGMPGRRPHHLPRRPLGAAAGAAENLRVNVAGGRARVIP